MNWSPIPGTNYDVSDAGLVRSRERRARTHRGDRRVRERILRPGGKIDGYLTIVMSHDSRTETHAVHRLVAEAFVPNPDNKPCVNHANGDKQDNRAENLEWCSYAENNLHAFRELKRPPVRVYRSARGVINDDMVAAAKQLRARGATLNKIAQQLNISISSVHRITK